MLDFIKIVHKVNRRGVTEIYPKFIVHASEDLMVRGGDFYAIWDESKKLWSTNEDVAIRLIDKEVDEYAKTIISPDKHVMYMWDSETGLIDKFHKFCQRQLRDNYHALDEKIIFSNTEPCKKDYASKTLNYALAPGDISAYEELISTLYDEDERKKIEWAIGSIVAGESKELQKFVVMYGSAGTGKSTILNIIQDLFDGYYAVFDAKALGQANNQFALEPFKTNPLVAIQHDGDLSKIEDNTRLNSLVSHELMTVNEKFKGQYTNKFKAFLFMGTNKPVKITDAKSGLLRRLIDVTPSGRRVGTRRYNELVSQVKFELGPIAYHCREVYLSDPRAYDGYTPTNMFDETNDFYNYILDNYDKFVQNNGITLKSAWGLYNEYVEDARVPYPLTKRAFKNELKNYFENFYERYNVGNVVANNYFEGFRFDKIGYKPAHDKDVSDDSWLALAEINSGFDVIAADYPAQYCNEEGHPKHKWQNVSSTLREIDTHELHYVRVPENHIVIDFDIPGDDGNKSFEKNFEAASKWPRTYAELSKSGAGIHLHYIYNGNPQELSRIYDNHIEIKVFTGNSSLRRKLTKCNNLPIASITSGLPLKEKKGVEMVNSDIIRTEAGLRKLIIKALNKEIHANTRPNIDFIHHILEDMYNSGKKYDVSDLRAPITAFALGSTNQAMYCNKLVSTMKFKSAHEEFENTSDSLYSDDAPIVFYDVEVFPNLFILNWKRLGDDTSVVRMINPTPVEVEELLKFRLVGFNCRRYDNHILYARIHGYNNEQLFNLSQQIISKDKKSENKSCFFKEAYNLSYTDIYDYASKKQSLKKWEIDLNIHHHELGLPWDKPVPEELWSKVAEYCDDDVIATEAVWNKTQADFIARQILAELADGSVNDTTNSLTTKIIFGRNRTPQKDFLWRDLSKPIYEEDIPEDAIEFLKETFPKMMAEPFGEANSILPYFEGYTFDKYKKLSIYKGEEVGEGGRVWASPGMYIGFSLTLDIASMHPHSAMAEVIFGAEFTRAFRDIVYGRVNIKHKAWDIVNTMLEGKLAPFVKRVIDGELTASDLANALKIAINSVYGLTAASFANPFKDPNNIDNIVAKRGALFMIDLKEEVEKRGGTVIHIKTDSIKLYEPTQDLIDFVLCYGERHGYTFEVEHKFEKICLVNNAVYIAKLAEDDPDWLEDCERAKKEGKPEPTRWTATGTQFQIPYVFKSLFSKEPIIFNDLCETKEVKTSMFLDFNEDLPDFSAEVKKLQKELKDNSMNNGLIVESIYDRLNELDEQSHDRRFIGKVGLFCPIKPGNGGGELVREATDKNGNVKYDSVTGTKGYRWLEAEVVQTLGKEADIDKSYYQNLVDEAVATISEFGDIESFID